MRLFWLYEYFCSLLYLFAAICRFSVFQVDFWMVYRRNKSRNCRISDFDWYDSLEWFVLIFNVQCVMFITWIIRVLDNPESFRSENLLTKNHHPFCTYYELPFTFHNHCLSFATLLFSLIATVTFSRFLCATCTTQIRMLLRRRSFASLGIVRAMLRKSFAHSSSIRRLELSPIRKRCLPIHWREQ